jgi:phage/plasmid-like protein (TIGR03299 family)
MTEETKIEMLNQSKLNWKVNIEKVQTASGIVIPDRIALVREDTNKVLGIHSESYVPYQNDELLELLDRISDQSGLKLHTGGSFHGGEKVWFQLKSNDLILSNDVIKGYISGFNSFDGRSSLAFGTSNVTVSCMNSFWRGYKQVDSRLRHSSTMKPRIDEILSKIGVLLNEEQETFAEIQKLGNFTLSQEVRDLVTKKLLEISNEDRFDPNFSTNKKNKLDLFNRDLNTELAQKGENLWGMFSGITRYTTHSMKKGDNSEAKMFGRAGSLERKIYQELVEMV